MLKRKKFISNSMEIFEENVSKYQKLATPRNRVDKNSKFEPFKVI